MLGRVNRNWQDTDYVLSFFGETVSTSKNRQAVKARSLVCYWAYNELGISQIDLAKKFCVLA